MATGVLADEIRHKLGELSPAERKVGRVLLAAYPSAGFETVAAIAERAQVSAPTVLRFVSRFGFRGFPDFQAALRSELQERNASPLSLYDAPAYGRPMEEGTDKGSLLDRAGRIFPSEVAKTLAELPPHDLDHAVRLLADARLRVTLAGGRFTHLLAQYLGLHLMQLREGVRFLPDRTVERTAALASLGRRDLLVLLDYRRYEADKVEMAELARSRGGKVLLLTDTWLSPVAGRADVTLPCRVTAPSPYDSLVPALAVIETVVAAVVEALGEAAHDHLRRVEDIAQNIGLV